MSQSPGWTKLGAVAVAQWRSDCSPFEFDQTLSQALIAQIPLWSRDPEIYAVVAKHDVNGSDSRFQTSPQLPVSGDQKRRTLQSACRLAWGLECFSKPTVTLMNGPTSPFAAGLAVCGTHRVAGEHWRLELTPGDLVRAPDAGFSHWMALLDDHVGAYLALCAPVLQRADGLMLGLITHCIEASQCDAIETGLSNADTVDPLLDALHRKPEPAPLAEHRQAIARCFSAASVADIRRRLRQESGAHQSWALRADTVLETADQALLATNLAQLRQFAALDRRQAIIASYTAAVAGVDDATAADELSLPSRAEMQSLRTR